jgi:hypothetical protein
VAEKYTMINILYNHASHKRCKNNIPFPFTTHHYSFTEMSSSSETILFIIGAIPKCQPDNPHNPGDKYTPEGVGVGIREELEFSSMMDAIIYAMSTYIIPEEWRKGYVG